MRALNSRLRIIFAAFAVLALIAGALLFFGAESTDELFSWTIAPPLTAATLGAFYWTALVLLAPLARGRSWEEARLALYPVGLIALLLLAATIIHLDRFDLDSLPGWFWLVVYSLVPLLLAWALVDQLREQGGAPSSPLTAHLPRVLRIALAAQAATMVLVGALLFISPGAAEELWPWALTPLTSRVLGSFVLGIGLAGLLAAREDQLLPTRPAARAYAALGALALAALLAHRSDLGEDGVATAVYAVFLVAVLLTGLYGWSAVRASSRS